MFTLTAGSRKSPLASWQTTHVLGKLQQANPNLTVDTVFFETHGDRSLDRPLPEIGGKGLFTAELEAALLAGEIDIAVHSLKDLPVADAPGLALGAITSRGDVRDVLVAGQGWRLQTLPPAAIVGTSSRRRATQLLAARPDLQVQSIRGNVETRVRKVLRGDYAAVVLAYAGISRLRLDHHISQILPLDLMLPAPGQGALAVQCRADDRRVLGLLATIDQAADRAATTAERAFLAGLGGGCATPVAALATLSGALVCLQTLVGTADGQTLHRAYREGVDPLAVGQELAAQVLAEAPPEILSVLIEPA